MNPERNKGGMTVNALMQVGLWVSAIIPVVLIATLGYYALRLLQASSSGGDFTIFVLVVVVCAIIVLIVVLTVNSVTHRKIKDQFLALSEVCRNYAGGDRTMRAGVRGDDAFAQLAMSLNMLLDSQAASQGGAAFNSAGNEAAALQAQIEKLLQEVSAVGDGDLRVQAEVTPDTLGVLADSFNYMIEELAKVVGRVQSTAVQVTNATRHIIDRSTELTQATETQVSQISQTTEAVEALAIFIQNVARSAQLSTEVSQEALRSANIGQQSVRQTIEGMMLIRENVQETSKKIKRLGERSNEIGEIVRIIEDIADQTNLLALNAAIQSAMAGEHGRGFAVVADEIRLLAERSTESTKRIATLVKSIQGDTYEAVVAMEDSTQEVVKGSQLADEAGRSLNSIYSAVERQAQMIDGIARAANEQATVSEAVAVAMGQISEITRQTNMGTQEAATSMSYLAELSDQLRASVSTFRLPDRSHEMAGVFPNATSVSELRGGNGNQFFPPALGPGGQGNWGQDFSGNYSPSPEPGNSGSLVALNSRNGQFSFNNTNQQDFGSQYFGSQPGFGGPQSGNQDFGSQYFGSQPGFGGPQSGNQDFGGQPSFSNQQNFGSQPGFDESTGFENQQGFGGQGQSTFPPSNQVPNSQPFHSGPLQNQQPWQPQNSRQRWQRGSQQNQSQSQFGQDQAPLHHNENNGQFGQ